VLRQDSVIRYIDHVRHSSLESKGQSDFVVNCMACICFIINIYHRHPVANFEVEDYGEEREKESVSVRC
jgi:hypothetical protein